MWPLTLHFRVVPSVHRRDVGFQRPDDMKPHAQQGKRADGSGSKLQQRIGQLQQMAAQRHVHAQPADTWPPSDPPPSLRISQQMQRLTYTSRQGIADMEWQGQDVVGSFMEQEHEALPYSRPPLLQRPPVAGRIYNLAPLTSSDAHPQPTTKSQHRTNMQRIQDRRLPSRHQDQSHPSASGSAPCDGLSSALSLLKCESAGRAIAH